MDQPTHSSYKDFTFYRTKLNPSLSSLNQYLNREAGAASTVTVLDFGEHETTSQHQMVEGVDLSHLTTTSSLVSTRIILIEDISPRLISSVGAAFDIDPSFFAGYISTDFEAIENKPPTPSLVTLPSVTAERGQLHLHYHLVMDLGSAETFTTDTPYALKTDANVARNVRRLPPLSGRQLALARACCLFLVDSPIKVVLETGKSHNRYNAKPLHGGYEDFNPPPVFSSFSLDVEKNLDCNRSMAGGILRHFMTPPVFSPISPQILSISYYALRVSLSEWLLYTLLISRYCKHYEYSLNDISTRLHDDDIIDLQRWRRRTKQSRQKLEILAHFIEYWGQGLDKQAGNIMLKDIQYIQKQLDDYSRSLEQMLTVATSMVQLLDSRRAILEAVSVRRLTYIALIFVPLSWVSSLFSMSDTYLPGHSRFWVYFAVAVPLVFSCFLYEAWPMYQSRMPRNFSPSPHWNNRIAHQTRPITTSSKPSDPVSSIGEIRQRCGLMFSRDDLQHIIAWVGLFGSFSRHTQTPLSDVDLLVGFKKDALEDDIYFMGDLTRELKGVLERDVDVLYMRYQQPPNFINCQALVTGTTVYGSNEWLQDNQPRAERLLSDTRTRFVKALRLMKQMTGSLAPLSQKELFTSPSFFADLIGNLKKLLHLLYSEDRDAAGINNYFDILYEWTEPLPQIIQRYQIGGLESLDGESRERLWRLLTTNLPDRARSLQIIYLLIVQEVFDTKKAQLDSFTME
ncbi:unnamed protein product [Clonostachys byssicola]|uniref:Polymerase beta nucleotidyltransferase domain-containing protein n=1 Tax=Clonostachys byssicola TaxID=160290 RepID=A0A9N9UFN8_9HYPO|nr:unnamed protein product [Clonostachys byssicola]